MELRMQSHEWVARKPDWAAAVGAGLVAGAVFMVFELLWAASIGNEGPWYASHHIAAIVLGPQALASAGFDLTVVAVALITHYVLGVVFTLVLATIIAGFHYESSFGVVETIGLVFGGLLYLFSFHAMTNFFPWMADLRGWASFIGHLAFGLAAAMGYVQLRRPRPDD